MYVGMWNKGRQQQRPGKSCLSACSALTSVDPCMHRRGSFTSGKALELVVDRHDSFFRALERFRKAGWRGGGLVEPIPGVKSWVDRSHYKGMSNSGLGPIPQVLVC